MAVASWGYAAAVLILAGLLWLAADRWWPATAVMFSPRWIWALPLALLVPSAAIWRRRSLWLLGCTGLLVVGPIMGLCVPWSSALASPAAGAVTLRVVTCNSDYRRLNPAGFSQFLAYVDPDIVMLQDISTRQMAEVFDPKQWNTRGGSSSFVASKLPIHAADSIRGEDFDRIPGCADRYWIDTPHGQICIVNVHLATPRDGLSALAARDREAASLLQSNSDLRRRQSSAIKTWISGVANPIIVAGDFNTPVESPLFRDDWSEYTNAFSQAGFGTGNTHFTRRTSIRIDHVLVDSNWRVVSAYVGPNVGPAHRPVVADLQLIPPATFVPR